ncbi:spermatogenesis-associated protein 22-like [Ixodes scapularis]
MQRNNAGASRGRASNLRQTTLPYGNRPRAPVNPPFRAPYQPSMPPPPQPPFQQQNRQNFRTPAEPKPRSGPGILQKPKPQLQRSQKSPAPQLPVWRPTAQSHPSNSPARPDVPAFGNLAGAHFAQQSSSATSANGNTPALQEDSNKHRKDDRILTAGPGTVRGVKGIVEVFGVLDSAPTVSRQGMTKHFTLRQDRFSVNCIFYQMDRQLGPLQRGSWLRCVGFMNRTGQLSVVCARPATGEEKAVINGLLAIANM